MLLAMAALYVYEADAAEVVAAAVGLALELHDSCFYGGDYYQAERNLEEVILLENFMEDDGEPFFQSQPVGTICLRVNGFVEARERLATVPGLRAVDSVQRHRSASASRACTRRRGLKYRSELR